MGVVEFVFAFFVFVLVCMAILLHAKLSRPAKQKIDDGNEKEKRLFKLYQNLEDMMNGIEEYVEESRREIAADKQKIDELLEKAVQLQKAPEWDARPKDEPAAKSNLELVPKAEPAQKTLRNLNKNELVRYMKKEGVEEEKIAKELGISRGEVSLILGIKK